MRRFLAYPLTGRSQLEQPIHGLDYRQPALLAAATTDDAVS